MTNQTRDTMAADAAAWDLPDSDICSAAMALTHDVSPAFLTNHCVRSYLFGRELAAARGLRGSADFDDEALFLACLLHDLGLTDYADGFQKGVLAAGFADRVHASWPRHDLGFAIAHSIAVGTRANPLRAPPFSFPAHLHEAINGSSIAFLDVVADNGWGDRPLANTTIR
ncbi:HD domain-containing protein [Mycolicibacterium lacusdiani]|uniref:HD domain-containing protein n=1 Tax=Mycolicibacterium lacusdiani TaxID=2895283 RepID=UPI001F3EA731|nr:HD domain-containing protein [Mycolicibacterium lacusdiani]